MTTAVRVELPTQLRKLAGVEGELSVRLANAPPVSYRAVFDALESRLPMLRGTIRDQDSGARRAYLRFFAGRDDVSHQDPDAPVPESVASGREPLRVVGAIAGG